MRINQLDDIGEDSADGLQPPLVLSSGKMLLSQSSVDARAAPPPLGHYSFVRLPQPPVTISFHGLFIKWKCIQFVRQNNIKDHICAFWCWTVPDWRTQYRRAETWHLPWRAGKERPALCLKEACYVTQRVGLAAIRSHIGILFLLCGPFSTAALSLTRTHTYWLRLTL